MKLFTKTLLFFIVLIILEALLTLVLITKIISKNNYESSRVELQDEVSLIYDSHNSWKRRFWASLIDIKRNKKLYELASMQNDFSKRRLIYLLMSNYIRSGIDYIILKNGAKSYTINLINDNQSLLESSNLKKRKPHPYLEIREINSRLFLVGIVRIGNYDNHYDIFLIKKIDSTYCNYLTVNRPSRVIFFTSDAGIVTTNSKDFHSLVKKLKPTPSYSEIYNFELNKNYYNIGVQQLEPVLPKRDALYMAVILSNDPYIQRITSIRNTAFFVTFFVSVLSIFISFFLSKNITNPIKALLDAMNNLKYGKKQLIPTIKVKSEIRELFNGFNEMSTRLAEDKTIMENYITEIKLLNDFNEKIFNSLHAGMLILDRDKNILKANNYFCRTFSKKEDEILGSSIEDLNLPIVDPEILKDIVSILNGKIKYKNRIVRYRENHIFEIKLYQLISNQPDSDTPAGCIFVAEDISKKIEFEEKIFRAEKLSSLSLLTAGVAHEINNPLSSIMSNVQNLLDDESDENRMVSLKWIEQETRRIAKIIHELLTFSSVSSERAPTIDVNDTIKQVTRLIQYSISRNKNIEIIHDLEKPIPQIKIDEDELKQVIINIINNSIHAIEKDGKITIKTHFDRKNGKVEITITDTGSGIPDEIIPKIFDPFFTTKKNGMGTGLGLSIVYGIVKKYGGNIHIRSKLNRGTSITLDIPIV